MHALILNSLINFDHDKLIELENILLVDLS
jgi:hypothetical protein